MDIYICTIHMNYNVLTNFFGDIHYSLSIALSILSMMPESLEMALSPILM